MLYIELHIRAKFWYWVAGGEDEGTASEERDQGLLCIIHSCFQTALKLTNHRSSAKCMAPLGKHI